MPWFVDRCNESAEVMKLVRNKKKTLAANYENSMEENRPTVHFYGVCMIWCEWKIFRNIRII